MTFDEMIVVLKAAKAGKAIQFRIAGSTDEWRDTNNPHWNWEENDYRAKPEPREWFLAVRDGRPQEAWESIDAAVAHSCGRYQPIQVREVLP
jgi:hypothetical protein